MSIPEMDGPSKPAGRTTGTAKALVKGLGLIEAIADAEQPLRLTDLVDVSGVPRATVLRLLDALVAAGALEPQPDGRYGLGPQLAVWGQCYLAGIDVRRHAEDLLLTLAEQTRETCFVGIREGRHVLYIAAAESPQAVRPAARVGSRNPLHTTGLGKVLLAHASPEEIDDYLAQPLPGRTPASLTEPAALRDAFAAIRADGHANDDIENEEGVHCVAVPVRDHTGGVVAAMSVAAPTYRVTVAERDALRPALAAAARELSRRLGHRIRPGGTR